MDFEAAHARGYRRKSLLLGNEIELFNTPLKDLSVYFAGYVRSVLGSLELQLFLDSLTVELTLTLTAFSTDPLETVIGKKFGHFFTL